MGVPALGARPAARAPRRIEGRRRRGFGGKLGIRRGQGEAPPLRSEQPRPRIAPLPAVLLAGIGQVIAAPAGEDPAAGGAGRAPHSAAHTRPPAEPVVVAVGPGVYGRIDLSVVVHADGQGGLRAARRLSLRVDVADQPPTVRIVDVIGDQRAYRHRPQPVLAERSAYGMCP